MHVELKDKGNAAFAKGKYDAAIDLYTEAICLKAQPSYHTNRALCYIKKSNFEKALSDAKSAIKLEHDSVKGHYFQGLSKEGLGDFEGALVSMEKALDICNMGKQGTSESFVNDIRAMIKTTKKKRAQLKIEEKFKQQQQLHEEWQRMSDLAQKQMIADVQNDQSLDTVGKEAEVLRLEHDKEQREQRWKDHFEQISPLKQTAMEVPDFLCCKISMDICADPCVTPSGITYDRGVLEQHLKTQPFDPVTRAPLHKGLLYSNLALKEAINSYYDSNPWADDLDFA